MLFHHNRGLAGVRYGVIKPNPKYSDPEFLPAYRWLEQQIGFFPLFVAVGDSSEALLQTGYQDQWRVLLGYNGNNRVPIHRRKGEFPTEVLFSFVNLHGSFLDSDWWTVALSNILGSVPVERQMQKYLLKRSWSRSRWLRKAEEAPGSVELVMPLLDLSQASRIWVRNQKTLRTLSAMGFARVEVQRMLLCRSF